MMSRKLDKIKFKKSDPEGMIDHLENFPNMCRNAWKASLNVDLPENYKKIKKFVIAGMGSSGISGDIIKNLLLDKDIVIETVHDYDIPGWVDRNTLVIAISYSGDTEETIQAVKYAQAMGAEITIVTTGGTLEIISKEKDLNLIHFDYVCQPRTAFPYLFLLTLSIFIKLGHFELKDKDFVTIYEGLNRHSEDIKSNMPASLNHAKMLAEKIFNKNIIIYSSGFLTAIGRRFKTQFNENSKNFSFCEIFPELNHNAIVGLKHPKGKYFVIVLESNFENEKNLKRQDITCNILRKHEINYENIKVDPCENIISEILTAVMFGDYVSYYLAVLNNEDPTLVDPITFLKDELKR
jgi:glucose/mannose-6-phosphate isomerase